MPVPDEPEPLCVPVRPDLLQIAVDEAFGLRIIPFEEPKIAVTPSVLNLTN